MVGIFAGAGFFGMLFFAVFLLRIMNRRTETMIAQFTGQLLGPGFTPAALGTGDDTGGSRQPRRAVHRAVPQHHRAAGDSASTNSKTPRNRRPASRSPRRRDRSNCRRTSPKRAPNRRSRKPRPRRIRPLTRAKNEKAERDARIALLLGKGQALLNLQQADTALTCFDEVIALDSTNAEAFVKKGMALEQLGTLDEAIDCYDRAIALDNSMTMAYLSKGGVFNRLERYGEALQCYEQALRAQQKPSIA